MKSKTSIAFPSPIVRGTFVKREKRFLAYMLLQNGQTAIAHCANTGSMKTSLCAGADCVMWDSESETRKHPLSWLATRIDGTWIGIDTSLPNRLVELAIVDGFFKEFGIFGQVRREVKISPESRIDIAVNDNIFIEVKNVTLVENGVARFPDAVTTRGLKHLGELEKLVGEGKRAAMVYLVQRGDGERFKPADDIDPEYGKELRRVVQNGVEVYALRAQVDETGVWVDKFIPAEF